MGISQGIDSVRTGVCTSTTRPASPFDGQVIYETDTDLVKAFNGTDFVTVGPVVIGESVSFTPTFTNFTLGNGTATASYVLVNKLCFMTLKVTLGSTSSVTGNIAVNLPFTATQSPLFGSNALISDAGTANYVGFVYQAGTAVVYLFIQNVAGTYPTRVGTSPTIPMTWANTDSFSMTHVFEVA